MPCRYERRAKERAERDEAAVVEVIFLPILLSRAFLSRASHILRSGQDVSQAHVERAPLVERDYRVDVEDRVGKCVVITSATPTNGQGGFYCEVMIIACA